MRLPRIIPILTAAILFSFGCDSANPVQSDSDSESLANDATDFIGKKGGKPGDGGSGDNVPMLVTLDYPSGAPGNALLDADNVAGRIGTSYTVGFTFDPNAADWDPDGTWATSAACATGYRFGILEVLGKGGLLSEIILRGGDGAGTEVASEKIDVTTPRDPDAANGFTLNVDLSIPVLQGKGRSRFEVCTVYVENLVYTPVGP